MADEYSRTCEKCLKTMKIDNFYTYRDGRKTEMCKACLTMHIDNFDESTYLWLLEKIDVPYLPDEWNVIRDKAYAKNPNLNGMSVFGKYLSRMKLKQFINSGWADSERLQEERGQKTESKKAELEARDKMYQEQFENGEINEAQYRTLTSTPTQKKADDAAGPTIMNAAANPFETLPSSRIEMPNPAEDLTDEDLKKLIMKWGRLYKPEEMLELETMYQSMTKSFEIQDADTQNTLLVICKTNLKMNQAIDIGDLDGFQKLSKVYESLRKSAKFTAAQNKEDKKELFNCVGELVAYCEKEGGKIPKYEIKTDYDIVDKVIKDLKNYNKGLIEEDKALAKQIEDYIKQREIMERQKKEKKEAEARGEEYTMLNDDDYNNYFNYLYEDKLLDEEEYELEEGVEE